MDFDWKKHLTETANSTFYCSLATTGQDGVWVNPVYFAIDGNFNIFFISLPRSRHMVNIGSGAPVAVAIYATDQPPGGHVRGIQLAGWAQLVDDEELNEACNVYYGRAGASEAMGGRPADELHRGDNAIWKFVKIEPRELYYFDTENFDEVSQGRQLVPKEVFSP